VTVGNPFHETESEADALYPRRARRVPPVEALEHVREGVGWDPDSRVANGQPRAAAGGRDDDGDRTAGRSELDGIVEEIEEQSLDPALIPGDDCFT
jgi:hypothetical protein